MYHRFGKRLRYHVGREKQPLISEIPLTPRHWYDNFLWEQARYKRYTSAGENPLDGYERFFRIDRTKVLESGVIPIEIPLCSELELRAFMELREQVLKTLAVMEVLNKVVERSPQIDMLEEALMDMHGYGKALKEVKDILSFCETYEQDLRTNSLYISELEVRDDALFQVHRELFRMDLH